MCAYVGFTLDPCGQTGEETGAGVVAGAVVRLMSEISLTYIMSDRFAPLKGCLTCLGWYGVIRGVLRGVSCLGLAGCRLAGDCRLVAQPVSRLGRVSLSVLPKIWHMSLSWGWSSAEKDGGGGHMCVCMCGGLRVKGLRG